MHYVFCPNPSKTRLWLALGMFPPGPAAVQVLVQGWPGQAGRAALGFLRAERHLLLRPPRRGGGGRVVPWPQRDRALGALGCVGGAPLRVPGGEAPRTPARAGSGGAEPPGSACAPHCPPVTLPLALLPLSDTLLVRFPFVPPFSAAFGLFIFQPAWLFSFLLSEVPERRFYFQRFD